MKADSKGIQLIADLSELDDKLIIHDESRI